MKTHFDFKDNIIDKNLNLYQNNLEFIKRQNINNLISDIKRITAKFFTCGDQFKAKTLLEGEINDISRSNLTIVSFLGGAIAITYLFLILFFVYLSPNLNEEFWLMI